MTPDELLEICTMLGGQATLARMLPISPRHMYALTKGEKPISEQLANHINLLFVKIALDERL